MDQRPDDLTGMDTAAAKEYIIAHIASLKLTERKIAELDAELGTWKRRMELAQSKGAIDLAEAAQGEMNRLQAERDRIAAEAGELEGQIQRMRTQIPGLEARKRTIDPDLLEQELLIATGHMPGDEDKVALERDFAALEKKTSAEDALAALKAKMNLGGNAPEAEHAAGSAQGPQGPQGENQGGEQQP